MVGLHAIRGPPCTSSKDSSLERMVHRKDLSLAPVHLKDLSGSLSSLHFLVDFTNVSLTPLKELMR